MRACLVAICVTACGSDPAKMVDASHADATHGADLSHITLAAGWSVEEFRDLAALYPYVDQQFVDGPETYSNQVARPFAIAGGMGESLGVVAGRAILSVTATTFAVHDYGHHAPNTPPFPDHISSALWRLDDTLSVTSSSANAGDGVFSISSSWSITPAYTTNNVRDVALDPDGGFDAVGAPSLYYGDMSGVYRLFGNVMIVPSSDATSLHFVDGALIYVHSTSDASADLYQVASMTHTQTLLLHAGAIDLGEGPTPAPYLAWAVLDAARLGRVDPTEPSGFGEVASTTPDYTWLGAMAPPQGHALGDATYVIESNRALGIDRVLRFTHL